MGSWISALGDLLKVGAWEAVAFILIIIFVVGSLRHCLLAIYETKIQFEIKEMPHMISVIARDYKFYRYLLRGDGYITMLYEKWQVQVEPLIKERIGSISGRGRRKEDNLIVGYLQEQK